MSKALRIFAFLSLFLPTFFCSAVASAQQNDRITVTTVVKDNVGALPGVGVVVKGTTNGTMTDENGSATLNNVPRNATLVVSYLGYTTVEVPVNGHTRIDVTMEEETRREKEDISRQTVEVADKVVEKQMRIVQEIASLLGETAAETKIALSKLKESITNE